ncbi:MAG TPA: carboxypeptidase-like regulatory domain-containing protein, partial [Segetibacter sp.]|nr:carboxypeptidase-like regulatory domain-containing protein [Segetibacter sp.]
MKNRFTITICLLLCFGCFAANAQLNRSLATHVIQNEIAPGENGSIKGQVVTTDNKPANDVNVILKGTSRYAVTDENGRFSFRNLKGGNYILSISVVGLQPIEREISLAANQTVELNYTLVETSKQ